MADSAEAGSGTFKDFVQIGIIVRDLDRTIEVLSDVFGLGPFRMITYPPPDRTDVTLTYRGDPGHYSHRIAFAELGSIELEIVQPLEGESGLTEFLEQHGEGIHHIRFNVPELEPVLAYLAERGIEPLMTGSGLRPGTRWVMLDSVEQVGFVIEVMNKLPGAEGRTPQIVDGRVQL